MKAFAFLLILLFLPFAAEATCSDALTPVGELKALIAEAQSILGKDGTDRYLASRIRALSTLMYESMTTDKLPADVLLAMSLAKKLDPQPPKNTKWNVEIIRRTAEPALVSDFGPSNSGIQKVFVNVLELHLLAGRKVVPSKTMYGIRFYIFVDDDDRTRDLPEELEGYRFNSSRVRGQRVRRYYFQRRAALAQKIEQLEWAGEIPPGQRLIQVHYLLDEGVSELQYGEEPSEDFEVNSMLQGGVDKARLLSAVQRLLSASGFERKVASIGSGSRRYKH